MTLNPDGRGGHSVCSGSDGRDSACSSSGSGSGSGSSGSSGSGSV